MPAVLPLCAWGRPSGLCRHKAEVMALSPLGDILTLFLSSSSSLCFYIDNGKPGSSAAMPQRVGTITDQLARILQLTWKGVFFLDDSENAVLFILRHLHQLVN